MSEHCTCTSMLQSWKKWREKKRELFWRICCIAKMLRVNRFPSSLVATYCHFKYPSFCILFRFCSENCSHNYFLYVSNCGALLLRFTVWLFFFSLLFLTFCSIFVFMRCPIIRTPNFHIFLFTLLHALAYYLLILYGVRRLKMIVALNKECFIQVETVVCIEKCAKECSHAKMKFLFASISSLYSFPFVPLANLAATILNTEL